MEDKGGGGISLEAIKNESVDLVIVLIDTFFLYCCCLSFVYVDFHSISHQCVCENTVSMLTMHSC